MIEKEMESYWEKRKYEACIMGLTVTISNMCIQMINILYPKSFEERIVVPVYMIGSIFSLMSFILYFKRRSDFIF